MSNDPALNNKRIDSLIVSYPEFSGATEIINSDGEVYRPITDTYDRVLNILNSYRYTNRNGTERRNNTAAHKMLDDAWIVRKPRIQDRVQEVLKQLMNAHADVFRYQGYRDETDELRDAHRQITQLRADLQAAEVRESILRSELEYSHNREKFLNEELKKVAREKSDLNRSDTKQFDKGREYERKDMALAVPFIIANHSKNELGQAYASGVADGRKSYKQQVFASIYGAQINRKIPEFTPEGLQEFAYYVAAMKNYSWGTNSGELLGFDYRIGEKCVLSEAWRITKAGDPIAMDDLPKTYRVADFGGFHIRIS